MISDTSLALNALDQSHPQTSQKKVAGAAKDFEALMIGQMLRTMHEEGGWLGSGGDDAGGAAVGLAEEQLARTMAANGGLGLGKMIESKLSPQAKTASSLDSSSH